MAAPLWCRTSLCSVPTQERPSLVSSHLEPHGWHTGVVSPGFFLWAYECQAQTAPVQWQWPPWPILAGRPQRGLRFPSVLQRSQPSAH